MGGDNTTEAVRRLSIRHPVIQGPFGGGLSTTRLVSTVSNMGGLGSFGAQSLAPEEIELVVREIRSQTAQPFAINLWIPHDDAPGYELTAAEFDRVSRIFEPWFLEVGLERPQQPDRFEQRYDEQIAALLEARPPVFSFVFGVPHSSILAECRRRGIVTVGTATSVAEGRMLDAAGVDLIVASGFEGGGHRTSFLEPAEDALMGTFVLTQLVANAVSAPVIAAGGIANARGLRAALTLGAQAVQVGTAFLACEESGTTPEHRAILFSDAASRTTLTRSFSGRLCRVVRNRWTDEIAPHLPSLPPYPVPRWLGSRLRSAAVKARRTDLVPLLGGQIAPVLRCHTAAEVMESLVGDSTGELPRV